MWLNEGHRKHTWSAARRIVRVPTAVAHKRSKATLALRSSMLCIALRLGSTLTFPVVVLMWLLSGRS